MNEPTNILISLCYRFWLLTSWEDFSSTTTGIFGQCCFSFPFHIPLSLILPPPLRPSSLISQGHFTFTFPHGWAHCSQTETSLSWLIAFLWIIPPEPQQKFIVCVISMISQISGPGSFKQSRACYWLLVFIQFVSIRNSWADRSVWILPTGSLNPWVSGWL